MLAEWKLGGQDALARLFPLVYKELRRLAGHDIKDERTGHTLQPTALVHEAFLKLIGQDRTDWRNRAQFMGVAAQVMRRILVDHASRVVALGRVDRISGRLRRTRAGNARREAVPRPGRERPGGLVARREDAVPGPIGYPFDCGHRRHHRPEPRHPGRGRPGALFHREPWPPCLSDGRRQESGLHGTGRARRSGSWTASRSPIRGGRACWGDRCGSPGILACVAFQTHTGWKDTVGKPVPPSGV